MSEEERKGAIEIIRTLYGVHRSEDYQKAFDVIIAALSAEPCEDAISRQDALDMAITLRDIANPDKEWEVVTVRTVERLKSVTPKQKTAHWKWLRNDVVMCDKCGYVQTLVDFDEDKRGKNYCPSCGRKMEEQA